MDAGKVMFYSTIRVTAKKPTPECWTAVFQICASFLNFMFWLWYLYFGGIYCINVKQCGDYSRVFVWLSVSSDNCR